MQAHHLLAGFGARALGIDFGSASLRLVLPEGVALDEPAIVARDPNTRQVVARGRAAAAFVGMDGVPAPAAAGTPGGLHVEFPVRRGGLADHDAAVDLLRWAFARLPTRSLGWPRPSVVASCSGAVRDFEQQALLVALRQAGAGRVTFVPAALAAALGAGLTPSPSEPNLVVNLGAGVTEITLLCGERPVVCQALRMGGEDMDAAIVAFLRRQHRLLAGVAVAERLKRRAGVGGEPGRRLDVAGWDLTSGQPASVLVDAAALHRVLAPRLRETGEALNTVLDATPRTFLPTLLGRGVLLVGGGARLPGMRAALQEVAPLPMTVAEEPETCVARGLARCLATPASRPNWLASPILMPAP